jgi:hypothetical protein
MTYKSATKGGRVKGGGVISTIGKNRGQTPIFAGDVKESNESESFNKFVNIFHRFD